MTKPYKCRVEYLESTGTQYIDTGIYPTQLTKATITAQFTDVNYKQAVLGSNNGTSGDTGWNNLFGTNENSSTSKPTYFWCQWGQNFDGPVTKDTNRHTHIFERSGDSSWTYTVDSTSKTITSGISTQTSPKVLYLFACNNNGTVYRQAKVKLYRCQIWNNGTPVRDFIPVLDNSGRPAMYDQVSGQLFYNQGTGDDFTYGRQIIPVDYLESTGTQYIDTGYIPNQDTKAELDFKISQDLASGFPLFGSRVSASSRGYSFQRMSTGYWGGMYGNTLTTSTTTVNTNRHTVLKDKNITYLDGVQISSGSTATFTCPGNLYLNAMNNNGTAALQNCGVIYYGFKIWDNETLARDFIPCIDENLVPFMFDKVHNTVYLNAGTGQFKVGPNVEKVWGGKKLRKKLALALANLKKKRRYYCEVEYLESTGTQWIDTGYVMTSGHSSTFNGNIMWTQNAATANFFYGYRSVNSATYEGDMRAFFIYGASPAGRLAIRYGVNTDNSTSVAVSLNTKCNIAFDGTNLKVNGTTYATLTQAYTPASYKNMWLFWCNCTDYYSTDVGHFVGRIYNWQIFDNGILVRDFIPVLDWNMKPCLFDKVTEQLFYNQATSGNDFSYGREIHYVDYLESTGTQYIDTGVPLTQDSAIEVTYKVNSFSSGYSGIMGSRTSASRNNIVVGTNRSLYINIDFNDSTYETYRASISSISDFHNKIVTAYSSKSLRQATIDGAVVCSNSTLCNDTITTPTNCYIFRAVNTVSDYSNMNCYKAKIWNDSTLVRDFIPAIDENGVGYMFDQVTHTIFDNAGTGAFGYSAREVEYLESDGARAIISGVTVDDTCGYDVSWMALNSNDTIILGTKGSGDSRWVLSGSNNPNVNISWNTSSGGVGLGLNKIQTAQMNYLNDRKRILNGTPLADITTPLAAAASTYNVGIFGGYLGASTISLYSTCRIYYAKITKGSAIMRDYIPAFKDGSPCLFDKVEQLAYFGTGTGSFTTGKIVEPEYE